METKIQNLEIGRPRQEEVFGFFTKVDEKFALCTDPKFVPIYKAFKTSLTAFDEALRPIPTTAATAVLTEADIRRDTAYHGLREQVRNMQRYPAPEKAQAAKRLMAIIDNYGDPTSLPYIQESGVIANLLQDLSVPNSMPQFAASNKGNSTTQAQAYDDLVACNAFDWACELYVADNVFNDIFNQRGNQQAAVVTGASKETRLVAEDAYRKCVTRINALVELEGEEPFATLVADVNYLINYQKHTLATREGRANNEELKIKNEE